MTTRDQEINDFKQRIDLRDYAASLGYVELREASGVNTTGMRHPSTDDKVLIGMGHDDHWLYYSVRDPGDNGSIIDFDQNRHGGNLGDVRKRLRPWLDPGSIALPPTPSYSGRPKRLKAVVSDPAAVLAEYNAAQSVYELGGTHPYLNSERALPASLLVQECFRGRVAIDGRGNALFPHYGDNRKLCGFEKKNSAFTGFSTGGRKGLWCSRPADDDERLIIAETAIDALSYAVLTGHERTRFVSIAGQMNPQQPALLNRLFTALPQGCRIVLALDHDEGGDAIAEYIRPVYENVAGNGGRSDLTLELDQPPTAGADWNDVLRAGPVNQPEPGMR